MNHEDISPRFECTYLSDPGHGWIACDRLYLEHQGLADKISPGSYYDKKDDVIWLEEDCDAAVLMDYLRKRGIDYDLIEVYTEFDAPVRKLPAWRKK